MKNKTYPKSPVRAVPLALLTLFASATAATAQTVVANFTGGTGTASSDQYTGVAGNGWVGPWSFGGTAGFAAVANTTPLATGGGNYLAYSSVSGGSGSDIALNRQWSSTNVPDTAAYRVSFSVRLDNIGNWDAAGDYFTVSASNAVANSPSGSSSFIIRAYGATTGTATAGKWAFYNGGKNSAAFNASLFQSSTMSVVAGTTYQFTVDVNPLTGTYAATIDDGTSSVSATALGFRSATFTSRNVLNFDSAKSVATDTFGYSIDTVSIAAIPEPSTYAVLVGFGAIGLTALRRRRRVA
jgi:hypothetical protein